MTQLPAEQNKDLLGIEQTYFIREMYVEPYVVDSKGKVITDGVSANIQAYISDVVYYIFYGTRSTLRSLIYGQGLAENTATAAVISAFSEAVSTLSSYHTTILDAKLKINDSYVNSNALFLDITITVTTSEGTISVKKNITLGKTSLN